MAKKDVMVLSWSIKWC